MEDGREAGMGVEPILLKGGRQAGNYYLLNTQYKIMVNVIEYVSHASGLHILFYLVGRKFRKPIKFELQLKEISFSNSEYCLGHSFLKKNLLCISNADFKRDLCLYLVNI